VCLEGDRRIFRASRPREYRGRTWVVGQITRTGLLTVEGERDRLRPARPGARTCTTYRRRHLQAGVGHFGVFSGRRWEARCPVLRSFIAANS
jgi:poly-beta-hydroxyalkanoate depolymerase